MQFDNQDSENNDLELAKIKCLEASDILKEASGTKDKYLLASAIKLYSEAVKLNPEMIEAYLSLAYISIYMEENDKALAFLNKVLEMDNFNMYARKMLKSINHSDNDD